MKNRFTFTILLTAFTIIISGCIHSLHPLWTKDKLTEVEGIDGAWKNEHGERWIFQKEEDLSYHLKYFDGDGNEAIFKVHFIQLDSHLFIDFYPDEVGGNIQAGLFDVEDPNKTSVQSGTAKDKSSSWKNAFFVYHLVPFHTFAKVLIAGNQMTFQMFNPDFVKGIIERNEFSIKHEMVEDGTILLTASSKDLQQYARLYANTREAFMEDDIELTKMP